MDRLISMTDFIMQQNMHYANKDITVEKLQLRILNYAMFLKQPLTLGMFVPCDLDGNVSEEPEYSIIKYGASPEMFKVFEQEAKGFQEAKGRVLFEGFGFNRETDKSYWLTFDGCFSHFIEKDLSQDIECIIYKGFKLTPTAQKQIEP